MNNEKLHRDQKGENQQYINTNPSRETRLPGQESRGLRPIQTWGKERSLAHPHPWTPTPPRASARPLRSPHATYCFTHDHSHTMFPFPEYPILQYLPNGTHSSGTLFNSSCLLKLTSNSGPGLPPHFRSIPCLQLI